MQSFFRLLLALILIFSFGSCSTVNEKRVERHAASTDEGVPENSEEKKKGWLEDAKDDLKGKVQKEIASLEINQEIKIFDKDIVEGINGSLSYAYQLEPSYKAGYYTRADRWKVTTEVRAGDLLQMAGVVSPIYLNIKSGDEIIFIRHFKEQKKALKALPYTPLKLPLTATAAMRLHPGDFVSIPTEMNILLGASYGIPFVTPAYISVNANASASYLVSSHFQLQIMKLADERIKVKLIAMKRNNADTSAGVSWGLNVFQLPGIKDLDLNFSQDIDLKNQKLEDFAKKQADGLPEKSNKWINNIFERDLIRIGLSANSGKLFEIDYTFNLSDPEAAKAYTNLVGSTYRFKKFSLFKNFLKDSMGRLRAPNEVLVTDLDAIEQIVEEDKDKEPADRRIERDFKGQNEFKGSGKNWKFGLAVFRQTKSKMNHEDFITYFNPDNSASNVLYLNNSKSRGSSYMFNMAKEEENWNTFMLLKANPYGEVLRDGLADIGSDYTLKDKHLTRSEQRKFKKSLEINLPEKVFSKIPWETMLTPNDGQKNVTLRFQILFDRRILNIMRSMTREDILKRLDSFNLDNDLIDQKEKEKLATQLEECFINADKELQGSRERIERFMKLQRTRLFERYGIRLLFSFIDPENLEDYVYFHMTWTSTEIKNVEFTFGTNTASELFPVFQRMQFLIDQGHFNLKLVEFNPNLVED